MWNFPSLPKHYEPGINEIFGRFDEKLKIQYDGNHVSRALQEGAEELETSGFFQEISEKRYFWTDHLTGFEYIRLLDTYANYAAMDPVWKAKLYSELITRIDSDFGGQIQLNNIVALRMARRSCFT